MIRAQLDALLESDFYFYSTDSNLYRPLWATSGRRAVTRRDAHASKICSLVYTHARTYASRFQIEGLARGYLSVTRWQAYAPPILLLLLLLLPDGGWRDTGREGCRKRGGSRGSAKVIIFRFMYKCFARGARPFLLPGKMPIVKFRGELKNALEAFARGR